MIFIRSIFFCICCAIWLNAAVVSGQESPATPAPVQTLNVSGEVAHPVKLTAADFAKLPRQTVRVKEHGVDTNFEGVPLVEILKLAGLEFGENLRGKRLETYLLVEAADNYRAVFALPELDPAFSDQVILLADRRDGKPLSKTEGNWRIIVPNEKRPARSVRQVVNLIIRRDRP